MSRVSPWLSLTVLASIWLLSLQPDSVWAQLSISLHDDVRLQDGDKPPLIVKPGQSFAGRLTSRGFEGVMNGSAGSVAASPGTTGDNPFREPAKKMPQPLTIQAGDVSLTLPMAAPMSSEASPKPPLPRQKRDMLRKLLQTKSPSAMSQLDRVEPMYATDADLLQMKSLLMLQAGRNREAAACLYDVIAMNVDLLWDWRSLQSSVADREEAVMQYRMLQKMQRDKPAMETEFLLACWERMLGHRTEALALMTRVANARPKDGRFQNALQRWAETQSSAPPAQ